MQYAGAHNPVYILRDGELQITKADRMPIGMYDFSDRPFKNNTLQLQSGDIIYIFSDGYVDQFGGVNGKKLKSRKFKELLVQNGDKPLAEQKDIYNSYFEEWRGDNEQVDDVLLIGAKV